MKKGFPVSAALVCLIFLNCAISTAFAETASCQIEQKSGKVTDCMEFSLDKGMLPASLGQACALRSSKNVHWLKSPCPRKNAVGACEASKGKGMKQAVYCYRKYPKMSVEKAVDSCKMVCKGTFRTFKQENY